MSRDQRPGSAANPQAAAAALFQNAVQAFQTGRLAEAEQACRRILAQFPSNPSALHMLGAIALRTGHLDDAKTLIGRALSQNPRDPDVHNSLGAVQLELKDYAPALRSFDAALKLRNAYPDAHANRARVLLELNRFDEAAASARQAVALRPDFFDAWTHLGNALLQFGQLDDADGAFKRAVALRPNHAGAHNNLGRVAHDRGALRAAAAEFRRAIELAPADPDGYVNLGHTLNRSMLPDKAEAVFRDALKLAPTELRALVGLGDALLQQGRIDEALDVHRNAVALHPADSEAHLRLGLAYMNVGRRDQSMESLNAALRIKPDSALALARLLEVRDPKPDDSLFLRIEKLLALGHLTGDDESLLRFALGKTLLKAKDGARAFAHLDRANRLRRSQIDFDISKAEEFLAAIARRFTPDLFQRFAGAGALSGRPIFVVGMQRSGTTLIEQILASHPQVWGGGELGILDDLTSRLPEPGYPGGLSTFDPAALTELGRAYLAQTDQLANGRARLIDKMPGNFIAAGLIALALPNARIISCRRNAVDTCLSCYSQGFDNVPFSHDLVELGRYWRAYDALIAHWRDLLPSDRFIDVQYEDVVADTEFQARRLVAFAGLEWDDACLAFHKTERTISTASINQVRQPIYTSSVRRWAPFAAQIQPLLQALGLEQPA